jgi:hypothetical protein
MLLDGKFTPAGTIEVFNTFNKSAAETIEAAFNAEQP